MNRMSLILLDPCNWGSVKVRLAVLDSSHSLLTATIVVGKALYWKASQAYHTLETALSARDLPLTSPSEEDE